MAVRKNSQQAVLLVLAAVIVAVITMWIISSGNLLISSPSGFLIAAGQLAGLGAAVTVLLQFMLMGRVTWIETPFGLDKLAIFHRLNGYAAVSLITIHTFLITAGYALNSGVNLLVQYVTFLKNFEFVIGAFIAEMFFYTVVITSIYIVRKKLKFESWYWVHMIVYAAIALAFLHQIHVGGTFTAYPAFRYIWIAIYLFVALNVLYWRFGKVVVNFIRFKFKIDEVVHETDSAVSIYIRGNNLKHWHSKAGQFVLVRILTKQLVAQEHPFSLSYIPKQNRLRITVKGVGDYTKTLQSLKPGASVWISGPYGSFKRDISQNPKRLYIAGGVGITPLRALIEESAGEDGALIYGNKTVNDSIFLDELGQLLPKNKIFNVLSDDPVYAGLKGYVTADLIAKLVPDYMSRDIFLCGPPPMMERIITGLSTLKFPVKQLHYERFSLHK